LARVFVADVEVVSTRIVAFLAATGDRTDEQRAKLLGVSTESVRRWRRLARKQATVSMRDTAAAKLEDELGNLPVADVGSYEQGLRKAIRRVREALEALEAELSGRDAAAAEEAAVDARAVKAALLATLQTEKEKEAKKARPAKKPRRRAS
jgi:hypothetical protein